jgi:hypothetical protein
VSSELTSEPEPAAPEAEISTPEPKPEVPAVITPEEQPDPPAVRAEEPPLSQAERMGETREGTVAPSSKLSGSARDLVNADGSLVEAQPRGPLAGLKAKLGG